MTVKFEDILNKIGSGPWTWMVFVLTSICECDNAHTHKYIYMCVYIYIMKYIHGTVLVRQQRQRIYVCIYVIKSVALIWLILVLVTHFGGNFLFVPHVSFFHISYSNFFLLFWHLILTLVPSFLFPLTRYIACAGMHCRVSRIGSPFPIVRTRWSFLLRDVFALMAEVFLSVSSIGLSTIITMIIFENDRSKLTQFNITNSI